MKKLLLLSLFSALFFYGIANNYSINFVDSRTDLNGIRVNQNDAQTLNLSINYKGIDVLTVNTAKGEFSQLHLQGSYRTGEIGMPQLPSTKRLIQVPFGAEAKVKVLNYEVVEYKLENFGFANKVMPFQPSYPKNIDPAKVEFKINEKAYLNNEFYAQDLAEIVSLGRLRGMDLAQLTINPIEYNPATNTIKVYNNLEVEVIFEGGDVSKTMALSKKTASPFFQASYKSVLNAKDSYTDNPDHTKYPVKYLIVTAPEFEEQLADFVAWKTKKGFEVIMETTDAIGDSPSEIKAWIHGQYNAGTETDPAPTFFLLVGDVQQVPASQVGDDSGKATDLYYACVDGDGDIFPDMYYGRFSAQTSEQLQNMLDKVLYYEKYEFADPSYLNDVTLIAGEDGNWNPIVGQPTINYGTENYFNPSNGFSTVNAYLDSYSGCYDSDRIKVGMINYTAHCSETSWAGPTLSQSAVNNFDNENKYPLAIGNCCLAADFGYDECIGETWMRKANAGAVAYIGSSPSSYWWEDYYWAVGAHDPIEGQHPTFEGSTLGAYDAPYHSDYLCVDAIAFVGNLAVTEAHVQGYDASATTKYYWEAYNCLSDPSLYIYLTEGSENTVEHLPTVPIGVSEYEVTAEPGSYVAISKDGVLYGAGLVPEAGVATIEMTPITDGGDVDIVVTKHQYIPYTTTVPAAALDGPYLAVDEFVAVDANDNGMVESGETFNIDLTLKNVGSETSEGITVTITSADDNVTLSNNQAIAFPNIAAETNATVTGSFDVVVAQNVTDQYSVVFDILITDNYSGKQEYTSSRSVTINSPKPEIIAIAYNDDYEGNLVNGILDAGETGDVEFTIANYGHVAYADADAILSLVESSEYVTLNTTLAEVGVIQVSSTVTAIFNITAAENTPLEEHIPVSVLVEDENFAAATTAELVIGEIPIYVMGEEDLITSCDGTFFDSGDENGDYTSSENLTMTFKPSIDGNILEFTFEEFDVESGYDYLYVYNGLTTDAEQIAGSPFSGSNAPGTILATNADGAFTFVFTSDGSVVKSGWKANFICVDATALPECAVNPMPADEEIDVLSTTTLTWDAVSGAVAYDVYFGETLPSEANATVSTNSYLAENLDPYTTYEWKVVPKNMNGEGPEEDCGSWSFTTGAAIIFMSETTITTCDATYTDPGGFENYPNDISLAQTILPGESGKMIEATFTEFDMESGYDYLAIYDGTSTDATLIGQYDGSNAAAIGNDGVVKATNAEGALTFMMYSDGSVNKLGWVASIACADPAQSYNAVVKVYDVNGFVEGAIVSISGTEVATDANGEAAFELVAGTYNYEVTSDYHASKTGTFDVVDAAVSTDVVLDLYAVVTFHVTDGTDALQGATISMEGNDYLTDESGNMAMLMDEGSFSYTVTMENYTSTEGTIDAVYNMDTTITIDLEYISVNEAAAALIDVYPNPSNGTFNVSGDNIKALTILNAAGTIVYKEEIVNTTTEIADLEEGIYFLQVITKDNQVVVKKVSIIK